jgi:beta-lactamase superfamily II metal-dependent hydrolase
MLQCLVFNVRLGQCLAFYPVHDPNYSMLIDCGHEDDFHPIDFLINYLPKDGIGRAILGNLTLTNYDHDHFSGLPYLKDKVNIKTVNFPQNLTANDLIYLKDEITDALNAVIDIKSNYTETAQGHNPPYVKNAFRLTVAELMSYNVPVTTNNLSQLVFITYGEKTICVTGDLEKPSWELMLKNFDVCSLLQRTNIFFASHHGRLNGYCADVFTYCKPECIVISDKEIIHGTQENMSQRYAKHVYGDGILLKSGNYTNRRKVITTRSDGHVLISISENGVFDYMSISI